MRKMFHAVLAALALISVSLVSAAPASASGTTYAPYASPNTYARIIWYEGDSIRDSGRKLFSASCSASCGSGGWGEMVMKSGDIYRLYVDSGRSGSYSFYSPVANFRFCAKGNPGRCTPWYNE